VDLFAFPPLAALLDAVDRGLTALAGALSSIAPGWGAALAVIAATLAIRALLIPLGVRQMRAQLARLRLAPQLAALQKRHARNPERLQQETMALYRRENVSPFGGFGSALVQLPIIGLLYAAFVRPEIGGHPNGLLEQTLLGLPLGHSAGSALAGWPGALVAIALLLVLAAAAWAGRRVSRRIAPAPTGQGATLARVLSWLPFLTVVAGALVPLAAGLYLAVSTSWSAVERAVLFRALSPAASPATA